MSPAVATAVVLAVAATVLVIWTVAMSALDRARDRRAEQAAHDRRLGRGDAA